MATVTFVPTKGQSAGALGRVSKYVSQEKKAMDEERRWLVSGQNCTPQLSVQEFLTTRQIYRKDSPVWFYHYVQSFHPEEQITPQQAHEVAKEFAEQAWPESEVLIATHCDAEHIHSHFIVNAVCFQTGKMLRQGPNTLRELRQKSDAICKRHQLSTLPPQSHKRSKAMSGREYRSAAKGQSWKFRLINTIDECMRYARSREEFIVLMRSEGYDVRWTDARKNITYTTPDGLKCRDDRLRDERYLKEAMEREFRIREEIVRRGIEAAEYEAGGATGNAAADFGVGDADADAHRDPVHDAGGGRGDAVHHGVGSGRAQNDSEQAGWTSEAGGDGGDAGNADAGKDAPRTGWEAEREVLFSSQHQASGDPAPHAAPVVVAGDPGGAGIVGSVVRLEHALERNQSGDVPVRDGTTMGRHTDSKALKKERRKKIVMGHKADDHEDEQNWQQKM